MNVLSYIVFILLIALCLGMLIHASIVNGDDIGWLQVCTVGASIAVGVGAIPLIICEFVYGCFSVYSSVASAALIVIGALASAADIFLNALYHNSKRHIIAFALLLPAAVAAITLGIVCACYCGTSRPYEANIDLALGYGIYEYDGPRHEKGERAAEVEYGRLYALELNGTFVGADEAVRWGDTLKCTVTVDLGDFENAYNIGQMTSGVFDDSVTFTRKDKEQSKWQLVFPVTALPELSHCFFVISLSRDLATESGSVFHGITVEVSAANGEDNHNTYRLTVNGSKSYTIVPPPKKGGFDFGAANVRFDLATDADDIIISVPTDCTSIKYAMYSAADMQGSYCEGEFTEKDFTQSVFGSVCRLVFAQALPESVATAGRELFVRLIASGNELYRDTEYTFTYKLTRGAAGESGSEEPGGDNAGGGNGGSAMAARRV